MLLIWYEKRQIKYLYLFSFIFGLALSHHQISLLLLPAFIYLFWTTDRKVFSWQNLLKFGGFFLLGLLPFLYLPIRAAQHPGYMWGDPGSLGGFFEMITRQEYRSSSGGSFKFIGDSAFRIWDWFKLISYKEFFILGFGLGIVGLFSLWQKNKKMAIFFLLMIICSGPIFAFFSDTPRVWIEAISMERFFIFSSMIFAIPIGLGVAWLFERFNKIGLAAVLIPLVLISYNLPRVNLRHYYYAYDLAQNILKTLPPNTVFFGGTDVPLFELWYLQKVENVRPDVKILLGGDPKLGGYLPSMINRQYQDFPDGKLPLKELSKKYPVYTANNVDLFWGSQTDNFMPEGIVYRYNSDANWSKSFDPATALKNFQNYTYRGSYKISETHEKFTDEILYYYINGWTNLGIALQHSQKYGQAAQAYENALAIDPSYLIAQNNFAGTLLERGQYQEAADHFREILKNNPNLTSAQNGLSISEKMLSK
jgi:tetratricopeptide (TPR) repeat protein